jgi:type IV pilus assembly protein PilB
MEAARMPWTALGALLLREGRLTVEQLEQALAEKEQSGQRLGKILIQRGWCSEKDIARALAEQFDLPFVDLAETPIDTDAALLVPEWQARRLGALVIGFEGDDAVRVAISDPTNVVAADELRMTVGLQVQFVAAGPEALVRATNQVYRGEELVFSEADAGHAAAEDDDQSEVIDIRDAVTTAPAIKLVNALIARAIDDGASDLHFEPQANQMLVRARVDGVLRNLKTIPRSMQRSVTSRLKIMGELDIAERRAPQDGRVTIRTDNQPLDLRIAVLPTTHGEQVVLRIMKGAGNRLRVDDLGLAEREHNALKRAVYQPHGAVIVVGPTGSGKTTTLYAALEELNDEGRSIQTIEDPVEAQIDGINQVEVFPRAGLTFASGLRTILRSDPDVLLVGEIRDEETARIAVQAAMTGHLVLSSLHAQSAPAAFARLLDMGVEPGLLATAVTCVIAQRLVRRLCRECKHPYLPSQRELDLLGPTGHHVELHRARGCGACGGSGYAGRVGLYELIEVEGEVRRLIGGPTDELAAAAIAAGTRTLRQDGIRLVLEGTTSLEELDRVAGDLK